VDSKVVYQSFGETYCPVPFAQKWVNSLFSREMRPEKAGKLLLEALEVQFPFGTVTVGAVVIGV
jgi:hypothetical protein